MCITWIYFINFSFQQLLTKFYRLFQHFSSTKLIPFINLFRPCRFHFFTFVFKKKMFSCWKHIFGKLRSHLFICIFFKVFICGFLDFIIACFSLLVGFIFFICGCYLIQFFILFCCHCTFPSFQKKHVFHIHHTCSGKQFLTVSFRSVMEKQWQRDSQFNRSKHLFIYPERKKFDGALLRWSELLTAKHLAEHS